MTGQQIQATDKFQLISDKLIALIEQGVKPWTKPWHSTPYQNLVTGHQYQGINPILCAIDMFLYDWQHPFFIGFAQAKQMGWTIKKGSRSTWIRWGGTNIKEIEDPETGESKKEFFSAFKWMSIFNVACLDDSQSDRKVNDYIQALSNLHKPINNASRIDRAEEFIQKHNPKTKFGGNKAFYHPATDTIRLPVYDDFSHAIAYYGTYIHELAHWTGHSSRCHRPLNNKFGTQAYAFEELIAELGAAMVCNELGINSELEHHAAYLDSWLKIFSGDKKAFFQAAGQAAIAANYLISTPQPDIK
jgi:antirestriction protein ArdC